MKRFVIMLAAVLLIAAAAAAEILSGIPNLQPDNKAEFTQISQEEAQRIMREEENFIIVDVRRQDEYDQGHIPGAICIPNEDIHTEPIGQLLDKEQRILVYCRSGRRSKEAARKLAEMGYTQVLEFGGITAWTGSIEK